LELSDGPIAVAFEETYKATAIDDNGKYFRYTHNLGFYATGKRSMVIYHKRPYFFRRPQPSKLFHCVGVIVEDGIWLIVVERLGYLGAHEML